VARKKLSEFRAKTILLAALGRPYAGLPLDTANPKWQDSLKTLDPQAKYVVKVDEGVKGRFKKGLVFLEQTPDQIPAAVKALQGKGYQYVLIEPYQTHDVAAEYYLSIERTRVANSVTFSVKGGVNVEQHQDSLRHEPVTPSTPAKVEEALGLSADTLRALVQAFDDNYFSFLEINPLVVQRDTPLLLDAAVEVDGEAEPFAGGRWTQDDLRSTKAKTPEELAVAELADQSQASFALEVLNPDGQVFLLLSGGGASVTLADEVANQGYGAALANYGEYSGNPSADEAYLYTREILSLLIKSKAKPKVLVIGGGVANFTDIRVTFQGVIRALDEVKDKLAAQHVKVFVRRGGPFEREGLTAIEAFLRAHDLLGQVAGPELPLSDIIPAALTTLGAKPPAPATSKIDQPSTGAPS
jgi:succinyl-CoA synthetase beta subunit